MSAQPREATVVRLHANLARDLSAPIDRALNHLFLKGSQVAAVTTGEVPASQTNFAQELAAIYSLREDVAQGRVSLTKEEFEGYRKQIANLTPALNMLVESIRTQHARLLAEQRIVNEAERRKHRKNLWMQGAKGAGMVVASIAALLLTPPIVQFARDFYPDNLASNAASPDPDRRASPATGAVAHSGR